VNGKFGDSQFAIFPQSRLDWGRTYRVQFDYRIGAGSLKRKGWYFTTRGLPHPYYKVDGQPSSSFSVISGKSYSIYFVPRNANDTIGGFSSSYGHGMVISNEFYDSNTLTINVTGAIGQSASYTFTNGQQMTLTISSTDLAQNNELPSDNDSDGIPDEMDAFPNNIAASVDTDTDGKPDQWNFGCYSACQSTSGLILDVDDDDDGLTDQWETDNGLDPLKSDTDDDGLPDAWEVANGTNPLVDDAGLDLDGDNYTNLEEFEAGTAANDPDYYPRGSGVLQAILPLLLNQ